MSKTRPQTIQGYMVDVTGDSIGAPVLCADYDTVRISVFGATAGTFEILTSDMELISPPDFSIASSKINRYSTQAVLRGDNNEPHATDGTETIPVDLSLAVNQNSVWEVSLASARIVAVKVLGIVGDTNIAISLFNNNS